MGCTILKNVKAFLPDFKRSLKTQWFENYINFASILLTYDIQPETVFRRDTEKPVQIPASAPHD